jgi:hypothetical protein
MELNGEKARICRPELKKRQKAENLECHRAENPKVRKLESWS